jgi:hypothetical protein
MKANTSNKKTVKKPAHPNEAPSDYKDPTGSKAPSGHPKENSGYDEKQPAKSEKG